MVGSPGNLATVVNTAISSQKLAQESASVVANNISNVNTPGFSRKELVYSSRVLDGVGIGVEMKNVVRHTDDLKSEQLREMTGALRKLEVLKNFYLNLDAQMGKPGEDSSLSSSFNDLAQSIQKLALRPEVDGSRTSLLRSADRLTRDINRMADTLQDMRTKADMEIYNQISQVNTLLEHVEKINKEIIYAQGKGASNVELLDKRDQTLLELSRYMDVRVQKTSNETVNIFSKGGQSLVLDSAHKLTFSPSAGINASSAYPATLTGILIDNDPTKDVTTQIKEGSLAGYLAARDTDLPNIQAALDTFASTFRDEFNRLHNKGTASDVPQTLTGTRKSFAPADAIVGSGTVKIAVIDRATGNLVEESIINLATIGTHDAIRAQIAGMGNATASFAASGELQIRANNAAHGIAIASTSVPEAYITNGGVNFGFSHYFGLNDFFTTGDVVYGNAPGASNLLAVRDEIAGNVRRIANTTLNINAVVGERAITTGGNQNLLTLTSAFEVGLNFSPSGTLPAIQSTLSGYAAIFTQYVSDAARHLEERYVREDELTNIATQSLDEIRGVNLQEEVLELMKWQRLQKASIQVLKTAEEMLDEIINIRR